MTIYQLKEVISSKYNRKDTVRYQRSVLFVIENTVTGEHALFAIDRISKHTVSLRFNSYRCGHRLILEHSIQTREVLQSLPEDFTYLPDLFC